MVVCCGVVYLRGVSASVMCASAHYKQHYGMQQFARSHFRLSLAGSLSHLDHPRKDRVEVDIRFHVRKGDSEFDTGSWIPCHL